MRKLLMIALGTAALTAVPANAATQPVPEQATQPDADAANAASMPDQGTDAALASPGAEPRAYPVCSRTVTDECVNPREAGRNHGNRPLPYWPGRPASDMR